MRKKVLIFLVAAMLIALAGILPTTTSAAVIEGDWYYTTYDVGTTAAITGYNGSATEITIPSTIAGLPVTRIGSEAFMDNIAITSVTIPDSVLRIESAAFQNSVVATVDLGDGVNYIGQNAFNGSRLATVTIPNSVTQIDNNAFANNRNLTSVTIIGNNLLTLGDGAFSITSLSTIRIPTSLSTIKSWTFGDSALNSLTIPANITSIEYFAFGNNANLNSVLFEGNAPTMGTFVFSIPSSGFTVYYYSGSTGFTTPTWVAGSATLNTVMLDAPTTYACKIGDTQYDTLGEALTAAQDEDTIVLFQDVTYSQSIIADNETLTIDLNGNDLTVSGVDGHALQAVNSGVLNIYDVDGDGGTLTVNSSGELKSCAHASLGGDINITGTLTASFPGGMSYQEIIALYANGPGSTITLTGSATGYYGGAVAQNEATITVTGDVEGNYYGAYAAYGGLVDITGDVTAVTNGLTVEYGGLAEVKGDITAELGIFIRNEGSWDAPVADIIGNIISTNYYAINAGGDADIDVEGNITGWIMMAGAFGSSAMDIDGNITGGVQITNTSSTSVFNITGNIDAAAGTAVNNDTGIMVVTGDITSGDGWGVASNSTFTLNGNIIAQEGVVSNAPSGNITINGNITANNSFGVYIYNGATVTVNGAISGANPYIRLDYVNYTEGNGVIEGNYMKYSCYTNNNPNYVHTVYVLIPNPVCEVDGVQYDTLDEGLAAAAVDNDTIKLLADINYTGQLAPTTDTWFNLNGHTLNVVNDSGAALWVNAGIDVDIYGEGAFNVTGSSGVIIGDGSSAKVTNATATGSNGLAVDVAYANSSATILGDATANGTGGAFAIAGYGTATIDGNVYAQGTGGTGVAALGSANITVKGYITAPNYINIAGTVKTPAQYSSITDNYYVYTNGTATVRARQEVCSLDGVNYLFLEDALEDAEDGDTITLLADIRYQGDIILIEKDLHFDLDTYKLNIGRTNSEGALKVDGGSLTIDDTDGGELNIVTGYIGVKALNGGTATVTSILDPTPSNSLNGYGIIAESGSSVTVTGDIKVLSYIGEGLHIYGGSHVHVYGDIYSLNGVYASGAGTEAILDGNLSATSGSGINADSGGTVTVKGDVTAGYRGVSAYGWTEGGGIVRVDGNVTATNYYAVEASAGSNVTIGGNAQSNIGLAAYGAGTTVFVKGSTVTTASTYGSNNDPTYGAYVFGGAEITVGGTITAANPTNYVKIGDTVMTQDEGILQGRYTVFTDGVSTVRLKGLEFFKENFESGMDGWDQSVIGSIPGWSVTNTLSDPTAAAHSGSYVAKFNSFSLSTETRSRLYQTESLNLSNGSDYWLEFWMYHDSSWSDYDDYITVQISTDGGNTWTNLDDPFYHYSETEGWKKEALSLAAYAGEPDVRIAFLGTCQWGYNIFIDDVSVSHECMIDGCSTTEAYGGYIASSQIGGETYYHVSTPEQLAHISDHLDLNFIQTADIDLADYNGGNWTPIGGFVDGNQSTDDDEFTGKYLGDGNTIDNLMIDSDYFGSNPIDIGLFARMTGEDALVDGLTVNVIGIETINDDYAHVGGIVGSADYSTITNCAVNYLGDVMTDSPNGGSGGIAGKAYFGNIENCTVTFDTGSIITYGWWKLAGGIIGRGASSIIDCHVIINEGEMIKAPAVGGIAGSLDKMRAMGKYVENCTVTGDGSLELTSQTYYSAYIGGIVGNTWDGDIRNCDNQVDINASLTMIREGESAYAGGIVGYTGPYTSIFGCENAGDVSLTVANNVITNMSVPSNNGEEYAYAGGITAFINGYSQASIIENCENNANITSTNLIPTNRAYAGGIVGHIDCGNGTNAGVTIINCANTGADKTVATYAGSTLTGGIAGSTTYTDFNTPNILIANCYNKSAVYTESNSAPKVGTMCIGLTAGGIVGAAGEITVNYTYSTASNVYALNNHEGDAYYGGIVGLIYNTGLSQNYYETNDNVTKAAGGIVSGMDILAEDDLVGSYEGATATQLKTKSFYGSGWSWYASGGTAPDYYSSSNPWRMTSSSSYALLKGAPYNTPVTPPSGGGGGSAIVVTTNRLGGHTTNSVELDGKSQSGTTSATLTPSIVSALLDKAGNTGGTDKGDILKLVIDTPDGTKKLVVTIDEDDLSAIAKNTDASLAITSPFISVTFDNKALETIATADNGGNVVISASVIDNSILSEKDQAKVKDRPVYDLTVTNGDTIVSNFDGGHATVTIPYTLRSGENPNCILVYYLADDGSLQTVKGHYDPIKKAVVFTTTHFSKFILGYNQVAFRDVAPSAWYADAVNFIAARGITSGTSEGIYSPNANLTRGQFVVLLMNAYQIGTQSTAGTENFSDAGNTYYTPYLLQAKALGIVNGVGNNLFAPQKAITRQEMIVMLYNALEVIDEVPDAMNNTALTSFNDADLIADWAKDAMTTLVQAGVISGSNDLLNPKSGTTRAEIAQVLYNLLSK